MKTNSLSLLVIGTIVVAVHLIAFAAVTTGAQKLLNLDLSRPADAVVLYERLAHPAQRHHEGFSARLAAALNGRAL